MQVPNKTEQKKINTSEWEPDENSESCERADFTQDRCRTGCMSFHMYESI